jgi:FMN phosphatase YigB (HAD superfamily)
MIGDDLDVDIIGARAVGMGTLLFDPYNIYVASDDPTQRVSRISDILIFIDKKN